MVLAIFERSKFNNMFDKLVAIEPVGLIPSAENQLHTFAQEVTLYPDIPKTRAEIISRIGDAEAILVNYTSTIDKQIIQSCPNLQYIGMCCSLYSPESANVDIKFANSRGITVTGIRDYGDEGVVEYVLSELIRALHGYGTDKKGNPSKPWFGQAREITDLKAGIIGLGKSGGMIADALHFLGAEISYFSRNKKPEARQKGYQFKNLHELLASSEVVFTCVNKNVTLLYREEFEILGNQKLLFNTGLSPAWQAEAFEEWIEADNRLYCDSIEALGNTAFLNHPNVYCMELSAGRTKQAYKRLSKKVLHNLSEYKRGI